MAQQVINVGAAPDDGTGDHVRVAFQKVNTNFTELYAGSSVVWGSITGTLSAQTDLNTALGLKAPLASPTFTGTVTLPATTNLKTVGGVSVIGTGDIPVGGTTLPSSTMAQFDTACSDGNFAYQSQPATHTTLTSSGAVSLLSTTLSTTISTTTGALSLGSAQTSGTIDLGSAAGTGTITLGKSTQSQTINVGTGAAASGRLKQINIGTGGLAGATTVVTIGSPTDTSSLVVTGTTQLNVPLATQSGGTGFSDFSPGVMLVGDGFDLAKLTPGAAGTVLKSNGTVSMPSWQAATGLSLPPGDAPADPANGEVWATSAGLFIRLEGVTYQLNMTAI